MPANRIPYERYFEVLAVREPGMSMQSYAYLRRLTFGRFVDLGRREARGNGAGAFDKQACCRRVDPCGHVQRGHQLQLLVGDPQSLAASGQNFEAPRSREDGLDQVSDSVAQVLAVVEHQQADPALQRGCHAFSDTLAGLLGVVEHCGDPDEAGTDHDRSASVHRRLPQALRAAQRAHLHRCVPPGTGGSAGAALQASPKAR